MRRRTAWLAIVSTAVLVGTGAGCTPEEINNWVAWHDQDPAAAEAFANLPEIQDLIHNDTRGGGGGGNSNFEPGNCASYAPAMRAAGLPERFDYIANRESGCNHNSYVSDSDDEGGGLLGLNLKGGNAGMWKRICGLTTGNVRDAQLNIDCAAEMYRLEGMSPWSTS